jgi:hypothetical protein
MIIVRSYSNQALVDFPQEGQQVARQQEPLMPNQLIQLINGLIAAPQLEVDFTFDNWDGLVAAARRALRLTVFRPVTAAERIVAADWMTRALNSGAEFNTVLNIVSIWANCGKTTLNAVGRLRDNYNATISQTEINNYENGVTAGLDAKLKTLPASAAEVIILDCDLQGLHNFLIEAHHGGVRYLTQGYQSQYSAPWWVTDVPYEPLSGVVVGQEFADFRRDYGNGADVTARYDRFCGLLAAIVQDGFGAYYQNAPAWRALPFWPRDKNAEDYVGKPYLRVSVMRVRNPAAVRVTCGNLQGPLSTQGVLSLPAPPRAVHAATVIQVLARLGLTASSTEAAGVYRFKVDATPNAPQVLKGKFVTRVGIHNVAWITANDLPQIGSTLDVGYNAAGLDVAVQCTVT